MTPSQPDLLPDDSGPSETFVRFDELEAFYPRLKAQGRRCIIQTLDRSRHGYECVVVDDARELPRPQPEAGQSIPAPKAGNA